MKCIFLRFDKGNLHSTLRFVSTFFGGLLLFVALHFNVLLLSCRFPVMMIELVLLFVVPVMSVDPRYQVMVGAGMALLLTTHWTFILVPSTDVRGLAVGIKDTLCTSTAMFDNKIYYNVFSLKLCIAVLVSVLQFITNIFDKMIKLFCNYGNFSENNDHRKIKDIKK